MYLHAGYPKNASTMLQTDIFPNLPGFVYCGRLYDSTTSFANEALDRAIQSISFEDSLQYDADRVKAQVTSGLSEMVPESKGKALISWEAFTHNVADRGLIATRLKNLFPAAKILFVIRNQPDSIESMYHFLVAQAGKNINLSYGRPSVKSLQEWISDQEAFVHRSYLETLKYYEIYSLYVKLFAAENVKILLFEDLKDTPRIFLDELGAFLSVQDIPLGLMQKRNSRSSAAMSRAFKLRNSLRNNGVNFSIPKVVSVPVKKILSRMDCQVSSDRLTDDERAQLSIRYKQGNLKLQHEIQKDLGSRGYPV